MAIDRNSTNSKCWRGYGEEGTLLHPMLEMEIENSRSGGHQAGFLAMKMKMELEYSLTPYRKRNSRQIKDLNKRRDTMKLLRKKAEHTLT